jgi:hypothetical protein
LLDFDLTDFAVISAASTLSGLSVEPSFYSVAAPTKKFTGNWKKPPDCADMPNIGSMN